jgi:hypothetical protein
MPDNQNSSECSRQCMDTMACDNSCKPAPAMLNGVEGLVQEFLDKEVHPTVRDWENRNVAGISILKHWRDFLISLTRAADNRDAAGVDAPVDEQALYEGLNYACGIHTPSPECTPTAAPAVSGAAYLRDLDGTGSMHVCAKGDPGAVEYTPTAAPAGEAVAIYQYRDAYGAWRDTTEGHFAIETKLDKRVVYTHPPAAEVREVKGVRTFDGTVEDDRGFAIVLLPRKDWVDGSKVRVTLLSLPPRAALSPPGRAEGEVR